MTAGEMLMMASLRDPYAAAAAGVGMLAASQLAQLNQLMMQQQQQQQHAQQLQMQQSPLSPSQPTSSMQMGGPAMGTPLGMGSPPECQSPPISRTYTYKKVTKPLLERKRRARINRCLDELKELMVGALEAEGENVSKLEKADILELTVRHLQRITKPRDAAEDASRFQAGFSQCASEACHFLLGLPGLDEAVGRRLVAHLGQVVTQVGLGGLGGVGGLPLGQGLGGAGQAALRPSSAGSVYSPPASPDQLGGGLDQHEHGPGYRAGPSPGPSPGPASAATAAQLGHLAPRSPSLQSGRDSPRDDAEGEVSSTSTSSGGWHQARGRASKRPRSQRGSEAEDSDDDDSDAPVNYTTEALRRQHSKLPRYQDVGFDAVPSKTQQSSPSTAAGAAAAAAAAGWMGLVGRNHAGRGSPSRSCSGSVSGSGSEDEQGRPSSGSASTWRPW